MHEETRLIIRARPGTEAAQIAHRLQEVAGGADEAVEVSLCADSDTAWAMLRSDEAAVLCQFYTSPERALCHAIAQNAELEVAIEAWRDDARETLALHRQNRRRSLLFEAMHLCQYADTGLARLGFASGSVILRAALADLSTSAPLPELIARAHLEARSDALGLREELDASAQLLSNDATLLPPLSLDAALRDYRAQTRQLAEAEHARDAAREEARTTSQILEALKAEAAEMERTLRAREEELEKARAECARLGVEVSDGEASLLALEAQLVHMRADRDQLGADIAEHEARLRERDAQLEQAQAERNRLGTELAEREAALRAREEDLDQARKGHEVDLGKRDEQIAELGRKSQQHLDQIEALNTEIARIMESRSMRITAPFRRLRALFTRRPND